MTSFAPDTAAIRRAWHGSATAVIPFLARRFQAVLPAFLSSQNPCARTPALEPESRPTPDLGRMVRFSPHAASSSPPAPRERPSRPAVLTGWIRRSRSNSLQPPHRDRASPARAPRVLRRARCVRLGTHAAPAAGLPHISAPTSKRRRLHHPVTYRRDSQGPLPSVRLVQPHPAYRGGPIALVPELLRQFPKPRLPTPRLNRLERLAVHTHRSAVRSAQRIRMGHDIRPIHLVVEHVDRSEGPRLPTPENARARLQIPSSNRMQRESNGYECARSRGGRTGVGRRSQTAPVTLGCARA